ncbi:MAG: hypothetical protein WC099_01800 [Candidatus Paceibacterota bacterium]
MENQRVLSLSSNNSPVGVFSTIQKLLEYYSDNQEKFRYPIEVTVDIIDNPTWGEKYIPANELFLEEEQTLLKSSGFFESGGFFSKL